MGNSHVHAKAASKPTLGTVLGAQLLKASEADSSLTVDEKLNVYRCETVKKHVGFDGTILGDALEYSCSAPVVGVVFYAGNDLGKHSPEKIAAYMEAEFAKNGVSAKVFIKPNHGHGSSASFIVRGGREVMNPIDPLSAIKNIEGFVANIKLVFFADKLITSSELGKWVKSDVAYIPVIN